MILNYIPRNLKNIWNKNVPTRLGIETRNLPVPTTISLTTSNTVNVQTNSILPEEKIPTIKSTTKHNTVRAILTAGMTNIGMVQGCL